MVEISAVLSATSWVQLGVPKNKIELRKLQAELHPDVCKDHRANGAFANLMKLYNGPDYDLRVASGVATGAHQIVWTPKPTFEDRLALARTALTKLHNLKGDFARFFPENQGNDPKELTVAYESGWWFLNSYTSFDSRTVVWIAKRLAGALNQSNKLGFAHCNISPATVLIMPEEHGLRIDGWWSAVSHGQRLQLRPDTKTPPRYLGGAAADDKLDIAQAAAMLLSMSKPDKMIAEVLQKHTVNPTNAVRFFEDIDDAARRLYGKNSWHPLALPKTQMI